MNFQQLLIILWARKATALSVLAITVLTTLAVSLTMSKQYVSTTTLVIDQRQANPVTGLTLPAQLVAGYMATQIDVIASHNVARKVVDKLKLTDNEKWQKKFASSGGKGEIDQWIADSILKKLDVEPSQKSSLIEIGYTASDNEFAATVANTFAEAYIQTSIELRAQPAKQSSAWFNSQKETLRQRLEDAQSVLSSYQQDHGIVSANEKLDLESSKLADLSRQLVESQATTNELQSRLDQLKAIKKRGGSYQSVDEVLGSSLIQSLKSDLARAESKFAELANRIGQNHPQYKQVQAEVSSLKRKVSREVKRVIEGIPMRVNKSRQRNEILTQALAEQKAKVLELKKSHDELAVLRYEVESAQRAFDSVMQKSIQTLMKSEISQTDVAVLNPAIPAHNHSKPRVMLNIILAIFLGGLLGIGAALIVELLDRRVRSSCDINNSLALPVFAVISAETDKS
jgi:chain length determinant protein EpsF